MISVNRLKCSVIITKNVLLITNLVTIFNFYGTVCLKNDSQQPSFLLLQITHASTVNTRK